MLYIYILPLLDHNYNEQFNEDEIGRTCSTHEGEEECIKDFGGKARSKRDH
jgi:hypothetical protein